MTAACITDQDRDPGLSAIGDRVMVRVPLADPRARVPDPAPAASADPDADAIALIAAGDARGSRLLMQRHLTRLHALAQRLLGNAADADEIAQDAFVRAWKQAPAWQGGQARFSTWLHQVVLNLCRDRLRKRREHLGQAALDGLTSAEDPERISEQADTAARVRDAIRALPERQREALVLCHYQGLSSGEAASVLEASVEALESLLARARRSLRLTLSGLSDTYYRELT
jgi:RNA polymerase sigma-70 factor (ECF subfamily)